MISFKKYIFLVLALFFIPLTAKGQDSLFTKCKIDSIIIFGNYQTNKNIILNELNFSQGDTVTSLKLKYFKERIFSLGLFSGVSIKLDKLENKTNLIITVEESWYIYPYPYLALKDRDIKKLSLGLDLQVKNFQGNNETIKAKVLFGYNPGGSLVYILPSVGEEGNYSFSFEGGYYKNQNKNTLVLKEIGYNSNFKQDFYYIYLGVGKRYGIFSRVNLLFGFEYIISPFFNREISASNSRFDRIPSIGISYNYDTRDLSQFPSEGINFNISATEKGMRVSNVNYQIFSFEYKQFIPFGDFISKYRFYSRNVFGNSLPIFDYSYLGFDERIRGHYNLESVGRYLNKLSIELTYPIIKQYNINLEFIPIIPNSLLRYRVGLYSQIFGESGAVYESYQKISLNKLNNGFGFGLTVLILPYNIIRTEIAFNEKLKSQFIFDLGISF